MDKKSFAAGDVITISVDVKNTGNVAGKEAVMLFSSDLIASLSPDVRHLRAFEKISLQPGEMTTVTLELLADDLAFVNENGKWTLEEGDFKLQVGDKIETIRCVQTKIWDTLNK